jgi:hypothetical protein
MKKKIVVLASVFMLLTSTGCNAAVTTAQSIPNVDKIKAAVINFSDIAQHWAKDAILKAVQKGYVDGYEDGTFKTDQNVSRAEFIKMIVTALKLPVSGETTGSSWYVPYLNAAIAAGILRASDFSANGINMPISRLEMARIAVRATEPTFQNKAVQIDDKSVMYNATKVGLIQGLAYGELGPDKATTRAQSVTIIERVLTVKDGGKLEVDKYALGNAELALKKTNIFTVMPEFFGGDPSGDFKGGWNPSELFIESMDGIFKATLDQIIAIDLDDPKDPNRYLISDKMDEYKWSVGSKMVGNLIDVKDAYVVYFKSHVDYNKDETMYGSRLGKNIYGFVNDLPAMWDGNLVGIAAISLNIPGDTPAVLIPKNNYKTDGGIRIELNTPARPPLPIVYKKILDVKTSK